MKKFIIALLLSSSLLIAYSVGVYNLSGHEIAAFACHDGRCPYNCVNNGSENGTADIIKNGACSTDKGGACQYYNGDKKTSLGIQVIDSNAKNYGCVYYATYDTLGDGNYIIYGGPKNGAGLWAYNGKVYNGYGNNYPAFGTTNNYVGNPGWNRLESKSDEVSGASLGSYLQNATNVPITTGQSCNLN